MSDAKHSPPPWKISVAGPNVVVVDANENFVLQAWAPPGLTTKNLAVCQRIVQAVNAHDDLVAALKGLCAKLDHGWTNNPDHFRVRVPLLRAGEDAIKKAEAPA